MLQKEKSPTRLANSTTSKKITTNIDTPIQYLKGVGPRIASIFATKNIHTIKDLLFYFPRTYEDRSQFKTISQLDAGAKATLKLNILSKRRFSMRNRKSILEVRCSDQTGTMSLKWFYSPKGLESQLTPGKNIIISGTVKKYLSRHEIIHPEVSFKENTVDSGRVIPVYSEIEGISTRQLRKMIFFALENHKKTLKEDLPLHLLKKHCLPALEQAIETIHFPSKEISLDDIATFNTPQQHRLIYEEFLKFEYIVLKQRLHMEKKFSTSFSMDQSLKSYQSLAKLLPFELTDDQKKSITTIIEDLSFSHPMNRLIQGDVGSGKTAVAFLTASAVLAQGNQAAFMAPTEILAEQHYKNACNLFSNKLNVCLLTGKTSTPERQGIQNRLNRGEPLLLIGTHALLEDPVVFKSLDYILIDEQQRFGVEQRRTLRNKGIRKDLINHKEIHPHTLVLTATPIPRTLALTAYGDLSISSIKQRPPGRKFIPTKVIRPKQKKSAFEHIRKQLQKGQQAYFIYPLVNESEAEGFTSLKSAIKESEHLSNVIFPEFKVGLLHGKMKPDEKQKIMEEFKNNTIQVLVSTTVIEVGVDVPNATVMVIEHAERFGLSQLHQLRGRVGRSELESYCFLFTSNQFNEISEQRLCTLEKTNDGFEIAEADLKIRGPGEFLGKRQSGSLPFQMANLVRDRHWLMKAREDALALLKKDPELKTFPENFPLARYFAQEGNLMSDILKTS